MLLLPHAALNTPPTTQPKKSNTGEKITMSKTKNLPATTKKQPPVAFSIQASVQWHNAAQQHAQFAVICAARAGAELNQLKEKCGHGEWQEIVAQLPFSRQTSDKYRALATELESRLQAIGKADVFEILELPEPAMLAEPEYAKQIEQINEVTGEQTLRQLYFDWAIVKQPKAEPKPLNLPKPKPLEPGETQAHRTATELIYPLMAQMHKYLIGEDRMVQHLDLKELKVLQGDLIDAKRVVDGLIKAG
jgi:hypothetical protein